MGASGILLFPNCSSNTNKNYTENKATHSLESYVAALNELCTLS